MIIGQKIKIQGNQHLYLIALFYFLVYKKKYSIDFNKHNTLRPINQYKVKFSYSIFLSFCSKHINGYYYYILFNSLQSIYFSKYSFVFYLLFPFYYYILLFFLLHIFVKRYVESSSRKYVLKLSTNDINTFRRFFFGKPHKTINISIYVYTATRVV